VYSAVDSPPLSSLRGSVLATASSCDFDTIASVYPPQAAVESLYSSCYSFPSYIYHHKNMIVMVVVMMAHVGFSWLQLTYMDPVVAVSFPPSLSK
jgi:hypothetical protein